MTALLPIGLSVAGLLFAWLCFTDLPLAVAVFAAILPSYLFRFSLPLPGFTVPTTFLEICFGLLTLGWLYSGRARQAAPLLKRWAAPLLLLLVSAAIATAIAPDLRAALGILRAYILEPVLFFFVASTTLTDETARRRVIYALGAAVAALSALAIYQKITGNGIPPVWQPADVRRVTSVFEYPNALGLFVAPVLPLLAGLTAFLAFDGRKKRRWLALLPAAAAPLGLIAIIFAVSKGAALGAVAGLLLVGLLDRRLRAATLITIIVACVTIISVPSIRGWFAVRADLRDASGSVRQIVWGESWAMLRDHPVFGAGLSGYPLVLPPYHEAEYIEIFQYPHDIVLNFWTELGLTGLAAFGWIVAASLRRPIRRLRRAHPEAWLDAALLGAFAAILVHGLVDVPYFKNDLAMAFWLLAALAAAPRPKDGTAN